ncbi:Short-chain dehydrogenase [Colletotrichum higginsianum IMI 349063]|uniref:Short-chain dehydrogenase n=3 Tax=Colletotrichum higginsianum TaxID=80884 RepID=A0A1B7Y3E1_COLHI|nr:Short-chain dehydrogenase [Colletotrichum higginsianum IMI 349063]OBR06547.1 Short-chain dehydrogenase [Colletotrichum higginsianum IMI 349063]TIC97397.1 hypothetical protein CH35J_007456 [Colletotrichum higginsianum]
MGPPQEQAQNGVDAAIFQVAAESKSDSSPGSAKDAAAVSVNNRSDAHADTQRSCDRYPGNQTSTSCENIEEPKGWKADDGRKPTLATTTTEPCSNKPSCEDSATRPQLKTTATTRSINPKPVVRQSRWRFFSGWIVHLPALVLTIGVAVVSHQRLFWYPYSGVKVGRLDLTADDLNNILQLPAKMHEIFIVASLSAIGLNMFRRRLIGDGVRLGFLTGGYRVGDLEYLISPAFWRQGTSGLQLWDILLAAYLVFATILSALVGPASAVLLIPTPGWYPLDHDLAFNNITMPMVYFSKPESVWPEYFSPDRAPWTDKPVFGPVVVNKCTGVQGIYQSDCAAGGFSEIWNWAESFGSNNLQDNITFQSLNIRRNLMFTQSNRSTTIATTPSRFFATSVGLFEKYVQQNPVGQLSREARYKLEPRGVLSTDTRMNQPIYQPLVQSKCKVHHKDDVISSGQPVYYPTDYLNCFNDSTCRQVQEQPRNFFLTWMNQSEWMHRPTASIFRTQGRGSPVINIAGQVPVGVLNGQKDLIYGCSLLASWVAANYTFDPWVSHTLQSSVNSVNGMREIVGRDSLEDGRVIRFNESWFPFLDPRFNVTGDDSFPETSSAVLRLLDTFTTTQDVNGTAQTVLAAVESGNIPAAELLIQKLFAVYLTDGLARTGSGEGAGLILEESETSIVGVDLLSQHGHFGGVNYFDALNATHSTWRKQNMTTVVNQTIAELSASMSSGYVHVDFDAQRYGYGSGDPRTTLRFAMAVMIIYLATVMAYGLLIAGAQVLEHYKIEWRGKPVRVWSVMPWGKLEDLSVLALRSQPPADENLTSSGQDAKEGRVWERVVRVRADDRQNLHLVVDESRPMQRVQTANGGLYF